MVITRTPGLLSPIPPFRWRQSPPLPNIAVAVAELERELPLLPLRGEEERTALDLLCRDAQEAFDGLTVHPSDSAHIRSLSVAGIDSLPLARALDRRGFVVGAGSACTPDGTASHVLEAMGLQTDGNLRLALPVSCDLEALRRFPAALAEAVAELRG